MNDYAYTANERWYLARTALWAAHLRAGRPAEVTHSPAPDVDFAEAVLDLKPGMRLLDLGCGWGRTTIELCRRGYDVTGFDLSADLLRLARATAAQEGLPVRYVQGSVRCLPELGRFDAVCAFYDDSLLSFEQEADNLHALGAVAAALSDGGRLLFGTTDCPLLLPAYQRSTQRDGELETDEVIRFNEATMLGESQLTYQRPGQPPEHYIRRRRHYRLAEVSELLLQVGLQVDGAWCAYDRALPYGSRPEGMVIAADRAAGGLS
ncbi:MAG: class I SAM-dependent methyltransferase [Dehalococcoidia bacterium]